MVSITEILKGRHTGKEVELRGWIYRTRSVGGKAFVVVRDGTGTVQVAISRDAVPAEAFAAAQKALIESAIVVHGKVVEDKRAPGGFEIRADDFKVVHFAEKFVAQVLLDRELLRDVAALEVVRADLEPTRGALVFDDLAVHDDSGLDECLLRRRECFRGYGVTRDCDLHRAGCIADHHERLAADGPGAVDPASQLDLLAGMASLQDFRDGDHEPPPYLAGSRLPFRGSKRRISRRAV